jgi:hypothetical protein
MKVRSNIPLPYKADRLGIRRAIIEVDFRITNKDDIRKEYHLTATDYAIDAVLDPMYPDGRRVIETKSYVKSYQEYDAQKAYLLSIDTSGLTGSELEDKLLQDALYYSLQSDPIYESVGSNWERYSDPLPEPAPVVEPTPTV